MFGRAIWLFSCLWIIAPFHATAADPSPAWFSRVWKSDDGLPNNQITGIAQTPDGYLWISTFSRPVRFDGVRFEEFFLHESGIAASQKITALTLRAGGGVWMGTSHGQIISLADTTRVFTNGLPDLVVQSLTEDATGALWATCQGGVVCRMGTNGVRTFSAEDGLPLSVNRDTQICSLTRDRAGRIWFAKNGRAGIFRNDRFESLMDLPPVTARLAARAAGGIWICTDGQLMSFEEGKSLESHSGAHPLPSHIEPTALLEDGAGGVWIGTVQGLFHYDGVDFETVTTSEPWITCLAEDREGDLWAGTISSGLNRVRPRVVELQTARTGLPEGTLLSLCEDDSHSVWATTQNGLLLRREQGHWRTFTEDPWQHDRASSVVKDKSGAVWIGTRDRALYRWQNGRFERWSRAEGLVGREIHSLVIGHDGELWLGEGTPDIVQRWRDGKFDTFALPANVRVIRAMAQDAAGDLWLGTSKGILLRIHNGLVVDETARTTGEPLSIRYLHATADGSVWIGYADDGAGWIKGAHFAHLTTQRGFPEDNVSQIVSDREGWLWFGGDHGIFKVRQGELEEFADGRTLHLNEIRLGQSEGLSGLEANCGASPGSIFSADGRVLIPMRNALAVINPARLREDPNPPPVRLRRVVVDDRPVASSPGGISGAALQLPPGYHRLEFEFTALSFSTPENVRFRYRLEGFDDNWTESSQRSASYSRLAAGTYRFRVTTCNSLGIWNEAGAVVTFNVAPFLWETWWFRLIALAVFTAAIAGIVRYISFRRLRRKLEGLERQAALAKERARIARDIHDDLGSRLTEVELMIELANRMPPEKIGSNMRQISSTVQKLGESLDEIVWAVNPRHDTLAHLIDYLGQYAIQFLQSANIRCRVDFPDQLPVHPVPPEIRHNLFLAVKEALNNAARHARATEMWLRVSLDDAALRIIVEDDGRGFTAPPTNAGADGLLNMQQRMNEIGGQFRVDTGAATGTRIELILPWPPAVTAGKSNGH